MRSVVLACKEIGSDDQLEYLSRHLSPEKKIDLGLALGQQAHLGSWEILHIQKKISLDSYRQKYKQRINDILLAKAEPATVEKVAPFLRNHHLSDFLKKQTDRPIHSLENKNLVDFIADLYYERVNPDEKLISSLAEYVPGSALFLETARQEEQKSRSFIDIKSLLDHLHDYSPEEKHQSLESLVSETQIALMYGHCLLQPNPDLMEYVKSYAPRFRKMIDKFN